MQNSRAPAGSPGPPIDLNFPVENLCRVSPKRLILLRKLEIRSVYDLISFFPRDYENWSEIGLIESLQDGSEGVFCALVRQKPSLRRTGKMSILRSVLADRSGVIRAVWFNQPYYQSKLDKGQTFVFRGKIKRDGSVFEVINPVFRENVQIDAQPILPIYSMTKGLGQGVIRTLAEKALPQMIGMLPEPIPLAIMRAENLCSSAYAYQKIHFPDSRDEIDEARKRLIFEELFLILCGLKWLKMQNDIHHQAVCIQPDNVGKEEIDKMISNLPFRLTADQISVCDEILRDMTDSKPMNRHIQGDVGSGKTIVAAIAMYACAVCGHQSIIMAPTSILAEQHHRTLEKLFEHAGFTVDLMLGSTKASEKTKIRERLCSGETKILVGTHAVLSEKNIYNSLALMITDEQHRFGVRQRADILTKNVNDLHTLVMSATPIPRTLGLILYGDLDISVISTMPSGRIPIETYTASSEASERIYEIIRRQLEAGRQVYYVCPLIESDGDDETGLLAVLDLYDNFSKKIFKERRVGLLHGGLKPSEKELIMREFADGNTDILVSTTVVEVGVDNPNASLMIIENAERFGLSTLHQLRGRIGRGPHRSVCILKSDSEDELAMKRLKTLCATTNGFEIAEKDLELRGPGDFFGTRQHGLPTLKIANLYRDAITLEKVTHTVSELFSNKEWMSGQEATEVLSAFNYRYGSEMRRPSL
jgi:ATP-dependent DNA helicase RecG